MTNKKSPQKKLPFSPKDIVFFTAYLKDNPSAFYVCEGIVERVPEPGVRKYYKVKVTSIGDRPVGGSPIVKQASLLGTILSKKAKELTRELSPFVRPPCWITRKV